MTYDEKNRLKEIYIKAVVKNERAKDDFVKAREQHKAVRHKNLLYSIATAQECALVDVMVAFFDDATIDQFEDEAKAMYKADPTVFAED